MPKTDWESLCEERWYGKTWKSNTHVVSKCSSLSMYPIRIRSCHQNPRPRGKPNQAMAIFPRVTINTHRFAVDLPHRVFKTPSSPSWIYSRYPFPYFKTSNSCPPKNEVLNELLYRTLHSIGWWHSMCFDSLMITSVISSSIGRGAPQLLLYWLDVRSLGLEMETCWNSTLTMQQMSCQSIFGTCFV